MLSLTRKTDYGLVALAGLARVAPAKLSAREIANQFGVPLPLLMNILTELARHGIVESTRGAKGGYRLAQSPEEISLTQLIEALEGPVRLTVCCHGDEAAPEARMDPAECDLEGSCPIKTPVRKVQLILQRFLDEVTLAHILCDEELVQLAVSHGIRKEDYLLAGAL